MGDKKTVINSFIWKALERCGVQGASFVLQIILARLLAPEAFGAFTIVLTFVALGNVLVDCGFGTALVQKKTINDVDISTIFYISIGVSAVICVTLYLCAPFIETFYSMGKISLSLRVLSITFFLGAFNSIQTSLAIRTMHFKCIFIANFAAAIISATVGILLAIAGYGIGALVGQYFINVMVSCIIMFFSVKWRPTLKFSYSSAKATFGFGSRLLIASLLNRMYVEVYNLFIGKVFAARTLGIYSRGKLIPSAIQGIMANTINGVMLPFFSKQQDNRACLKEKLSDSMAVASFAICPIMIGLAAVAKPLTLVLLTEKWIEIVPLIRVFSIGYVFAPLSALNLVAINALGRSDVYLKLEIIKRSIGFLLLLCTIRSGIVYISSGLAISAFINVFINAVPNKRCFNYTMIELVKDISPAFLGAVFMGIVVMQLDQIALNPFALLVLQVVVGVFVYAVFAIVCRPKGMRLLLKRRKSHIG